MWLRCRTVLTWTNAVCEVGPNVYRERVPKRIKIAQT